MRKFLLSTVAAAIVAVATPALAHEGPKLEKQDWSWIGVFGQYDKAQLKRGFQVYREVCSNCHSMRLMAYRNLSYIGLTEDEIKDAAGEKQVQDGPNDQGEMFMRPARPSDHFVSPFPNEQAARVANNGALPPDLS
ncbi:MAG TPA: cytochrome c1, partial [Patescibacteria group bacterium]|nr:cytochrome c1 [Patescibacteria group bacterium]